MLEGELTEELGYEKYDALNKETANSRNGYSQKTLRSEYGEVSINVPRDRKGEFEPHIVKKNQTDISSIENQIISMYAKGMSNRDIAVYIAIGIDLQGQKEVLGLWIGDTESSKFCLGIINELKNRGVRDILIASVDGLNGAKIPISHTLMEK